MKDPKDCTCMCHRDPNIRHFIACCGPGSISAETDEAATVRFINKLRADEGDCVTILCDNPYFNGQPNCAILCNGEWTDYDYLRFKGDTVLQCLTRACEAKDSWKQREERMSRHD